MTGSGGMDINVEYSVTMRIAIICKTFLKGGAEKQALTLAKLLADNETGFVLINWNGDLIDPKFQKYINDHSFRYFGLRKSFFSRFLHFQKILKEEKITIVISYLTLANFVSGFSKVLNKNVLTIGGIRNEQLPFHKFLFEKLIHNRLNDATVFNNYSARDKFILRGFNPQKIHVIQNAIELNNILTVKNSMSGKGSSDGNIKIITVGRFVRQKDYNTALLAFRELVARRPDCNFIYNIVGYGPLESEIRSEIVRLKIDQRVNMFINPSNIPELLNESDIFLSTSLFEGVSNSIMEAMVAGLPIVATNVGDNQYLIRDGSNGYLVPCRDVSRIVDKLEDLSRSEEKRKEFGRNNHKILETEFSKTRLLKDYMALFSSLAKKINPGT